LIPRGADLLARTIVVAIAGIEVLGLVEAARVVARPLLVFVFGLSAAVVPRSMEAGQRSDRSAGRRLDRMFAGGVVLTGVVYMFLLGWAWLLNPMDALVPKGYAVGGLVPVTIAATASLGLLFTLRGQLIGGGKERSVALAQVPAGVIQLLAATTAATTQAFAVPVGILLASGVRWIAYRSALVRLYSGTPVYEDG
jgi:hypothetical protein